MKLAILTPGAEEIRGYIEQAAPELEVAAPPRDDPEAVRRAVTEADILLAWRFPPELLAEASRLTWIQSFGAGVDHLMANEVPERVTITRLVDAFGPAMAEFVVGYCYAAILNVRRALEQQQRAEWRPFEVPLLRDRTAVVVGLGNIGRVVCSLLRANGVRVLGVSRGGQPVAEADRTVAVGDLDEVLPEAELLVLVLPLTPASRGLIDARKLARLPRQAWLINVGRGPLVVERDLLVALRDGTLAGAVLDVFEQEPLPPDHPFWGLENVIVTPHMSGPDDNALVANQFLENYRRLKAGQPLLGLVDRSRGY
jgi:glyoxylate/hydroxypyruvate reductase A